MSTTSAYPHIVKEHSQPARLANAPRVRVAQIVMDYLAHGWSVEEMCRHHEYLSKSEAHSAMAYYFDHQEEIDREIEAECDALATDDRQNTQSKFAATIKARGLR